MHKQRNPSTTGVTADTDDLLSSSVMHDGHSLRMGFPRRGALGSDKSTVLQLYF